MTGSAVISLLGLASCVFAQTAPLDAKLASIRQPILATRGTLVGAGAETLRAAIRPAQFVLIGEDHGMSEIPAFSTAVAKELAPLGYRNLVVEVGPAAGRKLQGILDSPAPEAAAHGWARKYPLSLAFYNWREEFDFLRAVRTAVGPGMRVIGIDQELMGAGGLLLDSLKTQSPEVAALREAERAAYAAAAKSGDPTGLFLMTAKPESLVALGDKLRAAKQISDADTVDSMLASRRIYEELPKSQLNSNLMRAALMKRNLVAQLPRDKAGLPEKALFKFGANHVSKGLNMLNSREIGNYIAEVADGMRVPSVHILIMAARGKQLRFVGVGKPAEPTPFDQTDPSQSDFPFAKGLFDQATGQSEWSLFDFRAIRDWADRQKGLDPKLVRMLMGYDFAIIIPDGTPSDEMLLP